MAKDRRSFSIDPEIKRELENRDDINASALVNEMLEERLFGDSLTGRESALQAEKERLKSEIDDLKQQTEQKEDRLEEIEDELEEIQSRGITEQLEKSFETVEDIYEVGSKWGADNPAVQNHAQKHGMDAATFVEEFENWKGVDDSQSMPNGDGLLSVAADGGTSD